MRKIITIVLASFVMTSQAQSIKGVLQQIEQNNLSLKAMRQENDAEWAESESRNQLSGPSVEWSPFYKKGVRGIGASELVATQEFDNPSQYKQRRVTAQAVKELGEANYRLARRELLWQAEQLCIDLVELNKNNEMLRERLQISHDLRTLYEKKLSAGDATALDMNKIKLDCIARATELEKNEAERKELMHLLQALNGDMPLLIDSLAYPADHVHIALDQLIDERSQTDASLLALRQQQELDASMVAEARKASLPKLSAGLRLNTEANEFAPGVLVGVSFPLYSNKRQVRAAEARLQATQLREQEARNGMIGEMRAHAAVLQHYQKSIKNYDLNLLRSSLELLKKAVHAGEVTVIEYYTEADRIYEQWQTYYTLEHDCQKIHAEIHRNEL